jgi:hypothetical protein
LSGSFLHALVLDDHADAGAARLDQRRLPRDLDRLGDVADFERRVDRRIRVDLQERCRSAA